jgi:hypothetical protein
MLTGTLDITSSSEIDVESLSAGEDITGDCCCCCCCCLVNTNY